MLSRMGGREERVSDGERRAYALGNRGPIRFEADGSLAPNILDACWRCGFFVFEGVVGEEELADVEADLFDIIDRLPAEQGSPVGAKGRPALAHGCEAPTLFWSRPLADPFGGTDLANGRHPVKMTEPVPAADAPKEVVYLILGSLQFSDACVRLYGYPELLAVSAAVNGEDFVPFADALFIKEPGRGASVAWHQDGVTHWESPDWDQGSHGFNFMAQLYGWRWRRDTYALGSPSARARYSTGPLWRRRLSAPTLDPTPARIDSSASPRRRSGARQTDGGDSRSRAREDRFSRRMSPSIKPRGAPLGSAAAASRADQITPQLTSLSGVDPWGDGAILQQ